MSAESAQFLDGVRAIVIEQGLGKARHRILSKQLAGRGGEVASAVTEPGVTHVIVGGNLCTRASRLSHLLKVERIPEGVVVVSAEWLSSCLVEGRKVGHEAFLVREEEVVLPQRKRKSDSLQETHSTATGVKDCEEGREGDGGQQLVVPEGTSSGTLVSLPSTTPPVSYTSPSTTPPLKTSPTKASHHISLAKGGSRLAITHAEYISFIPTKTLIENADAPTTIL